MEISQACHFEKYARFLLVLAVIIALVPVWTNTYFLTGDGPCHVYNAKVLLDFITNQHTAFYSEYYSLNSNPDPNWFSHILLAVFLGIFPDQLAEKAFLTTYVLAYMFALAWLLRVINRDNVFLVFLGLPFMFTYTFQGGFYNYAFSFVFFFTCIAFVLSSINTCTWIKSGVLALLSLCVYFTHPIGWLLTFLAVCILLGIRTLNRRVYPEHRVVLTTRWQPELRIGIAFLPGLILMIEYLLRKGMNPSPNADTTRELFFGFIELRALITMTLMEVAWALWVAILFGIVLCYTVYARIKQKKFIIADAFAVVCVLTIILYFIQPGGMAGAGILSIRLQFIPYLIILLWFATVQYPLPFKWFILLSAFALGTILIFTRLPLHRQASRAVEEIVSVKDSIDNLSTVLPLSYAHGGKTPSGELISNRIWLFMHAADYLGMYNDLVMLGNYEANTGYFPLKWHAEINPFHHLSTNEGIEHQPPSVDIRRYTENTGVEVDYVVTWCLDDQYQDHPYTQSLLDQLGQEYVLRFTSQYGRVRLYKRKSQDMKY